MILEKALLCLFVFFKERKAHACRDKSTCDGREAEQKDGRVWGSSRAGVWGGGGESAALGQVIWGRPYLFLFLTIRTQIGLLEHNPLKWDALSQWGLVWAWPRWSKPLPSQDEESVPLTTWGTRGAHRSPLGPPFCLRRPGAPVCCVL